jgi:ribosomal protein S27AE
MNRLWKFSGKGCPKCGDHMIINKHGHECGAIHCDYTEWVRPKPENLDRASKLITDLTDRHPSDKFFEDIEKLIDEDKELLKDLAEKGEEK